MSKEVGLNAQLQPKVLFSPILEIFVKEEIFHFCGPKNDTFSDGY